jgi:predicted ATPase/DNA-binding winged helix-turn-helix (wHTH) protein
MWVASRACLSGLRPDDENGSVSYTPIKCNLIDAHLMSQPGPAEDAKQENQRYGYRFGEFQLYPALRLLFRGDEKIDVGQTALSFILYMVENAGRPLKKKEIFIGVWDKQHVGDGTFRTYLKIFRDLFGRDSLITLKTRGYQCALSVEQIADLPPELVPPKTATPPRDSLPPRASAGIGRETELGEATEALARERALTVLGPGGIGKTWLAVELGWRLAPDYPGGVHLIDLASVKDAEGIGSAVAKVLGVALWGAKASEDAIVASLRDRPKLLLIFDSCDYIAKPAGALVTRLLKHTKDVSILTTSQEILHIAGEQILRLGPLPLDAAIELFCKRVHAADRRFKRDDVNRKGVAEICRRLDGVPHALELAAARVAGLGVDAVAQRLGQNERFRMLSRGPEALAARQQTLLATVEWSYGLLDAFDQRIFRRLSCFAGSFSPDAAIAVAETDAQDQWAVIDALQRLVDKSLLTFADGDHPRYRVLETLRLFGAAKLREDGEDGVVAGRCMAYLRTLFDAADEAWETMPDRDWAQRYGSELDNLRGALDWALEQPARVQSGIALCGAAGRLWYMLDLAPEGRRYFDRFVELIDDKTPLSDAARLLRYAGSLFRHADRLRAVMFFQRSVAAYRQIGDPINLGKALGLYGGDCVYLGRYAEARVALDEAWQILSDGDRIKSQITVVEGLGSISIEMNDTAKAREYYATARDLSRKIPDELRLNIALFNLAEVESRAGAFDLAIEYASQSARGFRSAGYLSYLAWPLTNLSGYQALRGNCEEARRSAEEALPLLIEQSGFWLRVGLQRWSLISALEGRYPEAAQLKGYVDAGFDRAGETLQPTEQAVNAELSKLLATAFSSDSMEKFVAEGASWTEEGALEFVRHRIVPPNISK